MPVSIAHKLQHVLQQHRCSDRECLDMIGLPVEYNLKMAVICLGSDELGEVDKNSTDNYKCWHKCMRYETTDFLLGTLKTITAAQGLTRQTPLLEWKVMEVNMCKESLFNTLKTH